MRRSMLVTFVALLAFTAIVVGGLSHATKAADEAARANERQLLENHLARSVKALLANQTLQVTSVANLDAAWADGNLRQFLSHVVAADEMYLVSPRGALLRSLRNGRPTSDGQFAALAPTVRAILAKHGPWPHDARGHPLTRWSGGFVAHGGRPAIITVGAIAPDVQFSLLRRVPNSVVIVRYLDQAMLRDFGAALLLDDMRFSAAAPADGDRNALVLRDIDGHPLGWLNWRAHQIGATVLKRTLPVLAICLLFFVIVVAVATLMIRQMLRVSRELAASEAQAQHHALHDPMLGLPNRAHVLQRLRNLLQAGEDDGGPTRVEAGTEAAKRDRDTEPAPVLLAYFDLDHFKSINESIGHHVGDDLLVQVVARVRARMGPNDILGRLASDEFVLVRPGVSGQSEADDLGEELMAVFAEPFQVFGRSVPVTASCGIAWAPHHGADPSSLLRSADIALFRAKQRGRARYRRFTHDMDASIRWRQDLEIALRRAITLDHLTMVYQPIVNVADGSIASFEALLRWHHGERGEIAPSIFVPVAEQAGIMPRLGDWVLRRVFADSHAFGDAEISVNLSPLQLMARDFLPNLKALIAEEEVDPTRFVFEITEGVLLDRSDLVMTIIAELRNMGFRIALDDFGTGYSSLAYLRSFPFDRIKIDRSFVQGIESDVDAQSILRAIVALGRTLRIKVVAEGVETLLQQQLVHAAGCQLIQGYLYWQALTSEQVARLQRPDSLEDLRIAV